MPDRYGALAVMYGGRVIDSYDRRLIRTYMNEYFGDFVFDHFQPFHFFVDPNKPVKYDYFIPELRDFLSVKQRWLLKRANITVGFSRVRPTRRSRLSFQIEPQLEYNCQSFEQYETQSLSKNVLFNQFFPFTIFRDFYLAYVDQLPLYNPPNILGLHANVEINYLSKTALDICVNMLNIQPVQQEVEEHSNRERKEQKMRTSMLAISFFLLDFVLSLIQTILRQIPAKKDLSLIKQKFQPRPTPVAIVLFQEIQRFNLLTSIMWTSLNELKQALAGQISFSTELDELNKHLYHGQLPSIWRSYAPQSKKSLSNWMEHFRGRNEQYDRWIQDSKAEIGCCLNV